MNVTPAYYQAGDYPYWQWYQAPQFNPPTYYGPVFAPFKAAWECPRCKAVNAPHVDRCECKPSD